MKQSGYIFSENWRSLDDTDQIVVVSMWENIEAWKTWINSYRYFSGFFWRLKAERLIRIEPKRSIGVSIALEL